MNKALQLFLLLFLLTSLSCFSQNLNCKKFINGEFNYPGITDKITIRKGSIQGSYNNGNLEAVWDVFWKTECEYEIICTKIYNKKLPLEIGDRIFVKIVSTKKDCYYSELTIYNSSFPEGMILPDGPFPLCLNK